MIRQKFKLHEWTETLSLNVKEIKQKFLIEKKALKSFKFCSKKHLHSYQFWSGLTLICIHEKLGEQNIAQLPEIVSKMFRHHKIEQKWLFWANAAVYTPSV